MADARGGKLESVDLLLALLVDRQHPAVDELLLAHGLNPKVAEAERPAQVALAARDGAFFDLEL